jgi:hypothetical protein
MNNSVHDFSCFDFLIHFPLQILICILFQPKNIKYFCHPFFICIFAHKFIHSFFFKIDSQIRMIVLDKDNRPHRCPVIRVSLLAQAFLVGHLWTVFRASQVVLVLPAKNSLYSYILSNFKLTAPCSPFAPF